MKIKCVIYCLAMMTFLAGYVGNGYSGQLERESDKTKPQFYLVGIGPGDADLITLRGLKAIEDADLIFCSESSQEKFSAYLTGKELIDGSTYGTSRYYGKDCSKLEKEEQKECKRCTEKRNELIKKIRRAVKEGSSVAVLGSGDPFIYGPSVWFLEEFSDLDPVIVPGLSSFNSANAALGKSVTESQPTKSVILTIGYSPESHKTIEDLSAHKATMVIYMPKDLPDLVKRLSVHYSQETPVALVSYAGYKEKERVVKGTLKTILDIVEKEKEIKYYLVYVGDFLNYHRK